MTPKKDHRELYVCDACQSHYLSHDGDACPHCGSVDIVRK